jgi:energy-coupling factor transporter ATP-binding protein EcfA2
MLDGTDVARRPIHELVSTVGIAFSNPVTQLSGVAGTVHEEVAFGPMNLGLPRDEILDRTRAALHMLQISELADRDPTRLSGGQQQLVAVAGLLALRPRHLVLDEPTAQLDPLGTRLVADALARLAGDGASILVTEQKTDLLAAVARRILVLDGGVVAFEGDASGVLTDPRLPELGVQPPGTVRLRMSAERAGLSSSARARLDDAIVAAVDDAGWA